jgi:hypothetical protein
MINETELCWKLLEIGLGQMEHYTTMILIFGALIGFLLGIALLTTIEYIGNWYKRYKKPGGRR